MGFEENIHEHNAARRLNILKGFKDFDELSKGHMDFGGQKPSNSNLTQKKVTDKRGFETTRWVKNGEDGKQENSQGNEDEMESSEANGAEVKDEMDASQDTKTPEDWVSETSSEDLQKFVDNPDSDPNLVEIAKNELGSRGDDSGEEGMEENTDEPYQTPSGESLEQFYSLDEASQRSVLETSMKHNVPLGAALAMFNEQGDKGELHGKIDAAQAALDDLKGASGHPDSQMSEEDDVALFHDRDEAQQFANELGGQVHEDGDLFYITDKDGNEVMESQFNYEEDNSEENKSSEEEADEHEDTYNKMSDDNEDGNLDTTKKEFGQNIKNDHENEKSDNEKSEEGNTSGNSDMGSDKDDSDVDNSKNEQVREWIGEDYQDEHINSVVEALKEADEDWEEYLKLPRQATSPEDEGEMVNQLADELSSEIQEGNWHGDMDRKDVENVLWGLIKTYNS